MAWKARVVNEYLKHTEILDWRNTPVGALAEELAADASDDEEVARRCFFWVRDQIRHSADCGSPWVTCAASEVLRHRVGFCFAKSHLLTALLRAGGIPAALCYQRLSLDDRGSSFCLHGLVAVFLRRYGWYRIDPRGDKPGVTTDFTPPVERLAFALRIAGEADVPGRFVDPLPSVVEALRDCADARDLAAKLPDVAD